KPPQPCRNRSGSCLKDRPSAPGPLPGADGPMCPSHFAARQHLNPQSTSSLPTTPLRFALHFFWKLRGWYGIIMLLEIGAAVSSILMPYAIGQIVGVVTDAVTDDAARQAPVDIVALATAPLLLFVGLS